MAHRTYIPLPTTNDPSGFASCAEAWWVPDLLGDQPTLLRLVGPEGQNLLPNILRAQQAIACIRTSAEFYCVLSGRSAR